MRDRAKPDRTCIPSVEREAPSAGRAPRSSTNWRGGTWTARSSARPSSIVTSPRTQTGCPQARSTGPGPSIERRQLPQPDLPLVAPDLEVDVDDVVVGDREPADAVADDERPRLGRGAVVPDDPHRVADRCDAERPGSARRAELRGGAGTVRLAALRHRDRVHRLALANGHVAVGALERPVEGERDRLLDEDAAVGGDGDRDVRALERERLGGRLAGRRERRPLQRSRGRRRRAAPRVRPAPRSRSTRAPRSGRGRRRCSSAPSRARSRRTARCRCRPAARRGSCPRCSASSAWSCWKFSLARSSGYASATAKSRPIAAVSAFSACAWSATPSASWARVRAAVTSSNVATLVRGVALHGLDEVRDQVVAAAELHVDLRPRVLGAVAQPDEPVVEDDEREPEQDEDGDREQGQTTARPWRRTGRLKSGRTATQTLSSPPDQGRRSNQP